ncbi:hypothetical protein BS47DRAFT_1335287 [Hydnum rufescens UP504]|uniref:Uncharacterized protein n=1 Tax=Hydnum rufescens UP504 TaxID=1448309 RepID=A0A9P6BD26_9AGAM|nr:hypothetical protein BS47DRAFT_1335287 [Hydnum rufescens UP504]
MPTSKPAVRKKKTKETVKSEEFIRGGSTDSDEDQIPKFLKPITTCVEEVEWEALNAGPDIELWAIRIPYGFKAKHLDNLSLPVPPSSRSGPLRTMERKGVSYNIHGVVNSASQDDDQEDPGATEMYTFSCLVPRKSQNGELCAAPIPISRNIIISEAPATPNPVSASGASGGNDSSSGLNAPPDRPIQPTHLLKHRFFPTGSLVKTDKDDRDSSPLTLADGKATIDVDRSANPVTPRSSKKNASKRKAVEGDGSPVKEKMKKTKKAKLVHV